MRGGQANDVQGWMSPVDFSTVAFFEAIASSQAPAEWWFSNAIAQTSDDQVLDLNSSSDKLHFELFILMILKCYCANFNDQI